ncbi:MAG: L-2-hydroxyglutarate oxidase [Planctomycetota bacterium]|nr:L-2-hydroxyglutarate oxidase [Planctomycetota bacterium]MDA1113740.1 L-2-hydroxyglutarate oxidase [Planctomycetota bacterium]
MESTQADIVIIGAGIVGLATAYQLLQRYPGKKVRILEKEASPALHQTGHNSGVLHSGIYYKPGSYKAKNCREGKALMESFCEKEGISYEICGKVIVALDETELPAMETIFQRGLENGVDCEKITGNQLREIEPHAAGIQAIRVPEAGIVSYPQVCKRFAERIEEMGGHIQYNARVTGMLEKSEGTVVQTNLGDVIAKVVVNCAGLQNDRVTKMSGAKPPARIVPFRGEYYELKEDAKHLCKHLIYPVPDPNFPFLGVHFTRMIDGSVECGPNAVLALAREGYTWTDINFRDLAGTFSYAGFWKMMSKHWRSGMGEMHRSLSRKAFTKALARLMPEIRETHLRKAPAGVRAQALMPDGSMIDDFLYEEHGRVVNVCNAPSPAATSSLSIGKAIVERVSGRLEG